MKYIKKYNEISSYLNLHGEDDYEITQVKRDKNHKYEYCDNVLYELSGRDDRIVYIEEVKHTDENMFYQDQIERYKEYIENNGILQTFPVSETKICENLDEMLEYLDERDRFDTVYDMFKEKNETMWNIFVKKSFWDITTDPEEYGFNSTYPTVDLKNIRTIEDLDNAYYYDEELEKDEDNNYDEDIYNGLKTIIEYFDSEREYYLLDFNHRFAALEELGKQRVYVEVMKD